MADVETAEASLARRALVKLGGRNTEAVGTTVIGIGTRSGNSGSSYDSLHRRSLYAIAVMRDSFFLTQNYFSLLGRSQTQ